MAVGWGALIAGIGLVVIADGSGPVKLPIALGLFALAGFLAGVRAEDRRVLHAGLGAVASGAFYLLYVAITWLASMVGGPDRPSLLPGGEDGWMWHLPALLAVALVGGSLAAYRLRPQGDQRTRRRASA